MDIQIERIADSAGKRSFISGFTPASFWWTPSPACPASGEKSAAKSKPEDLPGNLIIQSSLVE